METLETLSRFVWFVGILFKISRCIKIKKTKKGFRIAVSMQYRNK